MLKRYLMSVLFGEPHEMARIRMESKSTIFEIYPDMRFNARYVLSATSYLVSNNYGTSMYTFNTWIVEIGISPEFPLGISPKGISEESEPLVSSILLHITDTSIALEKAKKMLHALRDNFGAPKRFNPDESFTLP
jgi:hypothetical protein